MSHKLISHSPDLKKLRDEGYEIEIKKGHLLVHSIPYVNSRKEIMRGILVSALGDLAGDRTSKPHHVISFAGEHPCDKEGVVIQGIQHSSIRKTLAEGVEVDHSFSNKPENGYADYYEKVTTYIKIISSHAESIDRNATAKTFKPVDSTDDPDCVFHYLDANSSRAEIGMISNKLKDLKIAIIGLGGTGSYVLDFVAKTPVKEIHLFDSDIFLSHNAFRAPGAVSIETLNRTQKKVSYMKEIYSRLHKYVIPHEYDIDQEKLEELSTVNFVFICIDNGEVKKSIIQKLIEKKIPLIDVGIGITEIDGALTGSVRVTSVNTGKYDHIEKRVPFAEVGENDYSKNIQIAEVNALNAALAVIKWKKFFGVYHDLEKEYHSVYEINTNKIANDEITS